MNPQFVQKRFLLVGTEGVVDFRTDFSQTLEALRARVRESADRIGHAVSPARMIGFWQPGMRYFAGVEVSEVGEIPEGLTAKTLPESLFAVFAEERRGTMGSPKGYAYTQWLPGSGYRLNDRLPGDLEIFRDLTHCGETDAADILIPVQAPAERLAERINELCSLVDRDETRLVGIGVPFSFESKYYGNILGQPDYAMNDQAVTRKFVADGTLALLAKSLGICMEDAQILCARHSMDGDGNYTAVVGFAVDPSMELPALLPENAVALTIPACRFARIAINEKKKEGRVGYTERMHADEYFIGGFRKDTAYVYSAQSLPMNTYDASGDLLAKYEPVRFLEDESERYDSVRIRPVLLPEMKIACRVQRPGDDKFVISQYFEVQDQVFATGLARYDWGDYYGFPIDVPGSYASCFGSRVISFEGLPDCVERITLPGGQYLHVTQLEINGDNPSIPYEVAFHHLDRLYFGEHPEFQWDKGRKVIARFRQANFASVFVPIKPREN